jgi:hypothetical protein
MFYPIRSCGWKTNEELGLKHTSGKWRYYLLVGGSTSFSSIRWMNTTNHKIKNQAKSGDTFSKKPRNMGGCEQDTWEASPTTIFAQKRRWDWVGCHDSPG